MDVFAPARLGPVSLRNRIIKAATFEGATPEGLVTDRLIAFHRAVAEGGAALSTVAYLAVSPEGRTHKEQIHLRDEAVPGLRRLTDAVHEAGAKIAAQIGHAGPVANGRSNGSQAISASAMPSPLSFQMVRDATNADLDRIRGDYASGARLAARAGFDVLEIHLGHGYLLSSFVRRAAAFPRSIVQTVRETVGDSVAVTAKLSMSEGTRKGIRLEESLAFAQMLEADGCLDALQLSAGSSLTNPMFLFRGDVPLREFAAAMPWPVRWGMRFFGRQFLHEYPFEEAFLLPMARHFRAALTMPLTLLGGINRRETLDLAMAEGFDFVAMARALLREPDLVRRMQNERADGRCIHCNKCMPTIYSGTRCVVTG